MRFAYPWVFLLLLLIPVLHRFWTRQARGPSIRFPLPLGAAAVARDPQAWLKWIRYAALILLVVGLARPQSSFRETKRSVSGIDIMMVMDFSRSMSIRDLGDGSRLDLAKNVMERFIQGRVNDRVGFVAFAGEPITLSPPTLDSRLVLRALHDWKIGTLKDGTGIGDGLSLAVERLRNSTAKSRVVVLLTDGDNNSGQIDPATAGSLAAGYGIRVYTIAIGTEGRVALPIERETALGKTVVTGYQWFDSALNPELLQQIAELTQGRFYRVTDQGTLSRVFKEIDQLEKTEIQTSERVRFEENYALPVQAGLVLLVLAQLAVILPRRGGLIG